MTAPQLPLDALATPEQRRVLALTNGRGYWTLEEALDLARPGWRNTGLRFLNYDPAPRSRRKKP